MHFQSWMPFYLHILNRLSEPRIFSGVNTQLNFCRQLAEWLVQYQWHFTPLLSAIIEHVEGIPEQENEFIDALLISYPTQPDKGSLTEFILSYFTDRQWFYPQVRLKDICIQEKVYKSLVNKNLPVIESGKELSAFFGITNNELNWLAQKYRLQVRQPEHLRHYHYSLHKKRDGNYRLLESPKRRLKSLQRQINNRILNHCKVHQAAHGFIKKNNCKTHAAIHTNKKFLFVFDLQQCFQSIQWHQIYSIFSNLGYSREVSYYLTKICTHQNYANHPLLYKLDSLQQSRLKTRHLPQGAPSSPALSNLVLYHLDKRLTGLAKKLHLEYSRYADDLAFSGNQQRCWKFFEPLVGAICLEEGFQLNHRKSRILKTAQRQKLTGIVVNQKVNIDRRYYDQLKATLHNCQRHGLSSQNRFNHPDFRAHLLGCIQYVKSLNSNKGEKLYQLFQSIP